MCWHKRQMAHTCPSSFGRVGGPALYTCMPCKLYHRCRLGDCVQSALCRVTGALRVVIYEGQEAPAGGRSGGRRAAVAAADLAAADVVRAVLVLRALGACMPCAACADNAPRCGPAAVCLTCGQLLARPNMQASSSVCCAHAICEEQARGIRSHRVCLR